MMDAWSGVPTPVPYVKGRTPLELQGRARAAEQAVPQLPRAGRPRRPAQPALDGVATRQTRDQLIRQVIQGSGNMPAYGKNLGPAEVNALVAFLETLRPGQPAAGSDRHDALDSGALSQ